VMPSVGLSGPTGTPCCNDRPFGELSVLTAVGFSDSSTNACMKTCRSASAAITSPLTTRAISFSERNQPGGSGSAGVGSTGTILSGGGGTAGRATVTLERCSGVLTAGSPAIAHQ
jgi:hypothetical protein